MLTEYLVLNGPHKGQRFASECGPHLRLIDPKPTWMTMGEYVTVEYELRTIMVADGETKESHLFWVTPDTKDSAVTIMKLLIELVNDG